MGGGSGVVQQCVEGQSVLLGGRALDCAEGVKGEAKVLGGVDRRVGDLAVLKAPDLNKWSVQKVLLFSVAYPSGTSDRDLIQTLLATHDERTVDTKEAEDLGKRVTELALGHTENHTLGARRVDERTEDVEHGAEVELATDRRNVGERRVVVGREQEEEWGGREERRELLDGEGQAAVEADEQVGRARRRSGRLGAMLETLSAVCIHKRRCIVERKVLVRRARPLDFSWSKCLTLATRTPLPATTTAAVVETL